MTVAFRIESVRLDTSNGAVEYAFTSDLTVLAGQTGVGKTTLLELMHENTSRTYISRSISATSGSNCPEVSTKNDDGQFGFSTL